MNNSCKSSPGVSQVLNFVTSQVLTSEGQEGILFTMHYITHVGGSSKNGTLCMRNTLPIIEVKDYGMYPMT